MAKKLTDMEEKLKTAENLINKDTKVVVGADTATKDVKSTGKRIIELPETTTIADNDYFEIDSATEHSRSTSFASLKNNINNDFYNKSEIDSGFYTQDAINNNYYNKNYINQNYLTQEEIVSDYYTKSVSDERFLRHKLFSYEQQNIPFISGNHKVYFEFDLDFALPSDLSMQDRLLVCLACRVHTFSAESAGIQNNRSYLLFGSIFCDRLLGDDGHVVAGVPSNINQEAQQTNTIFIDGSAQDSYLPNEPTIFYTPFLINEGGLGQQTANLRGSFTVRILDVSTSDFLSFSTPLAGQTASIGVEVVREKVY